MHASSAADAKVGLAAPGLWISSPLRLPLVLLGLFVVVGSGDRLGLDWRGAAEAGAGRTVVVANGGVESVAVLGIGDDELAPLYLKQLVVSLDDPNDGLGHVLCGLCGHGNALAPQTHGSTGHFVESSGPARRRGASERLKRVLSRQLSLNRRVRVPDSLWLNADLDGAIPPDLDLANYGFTERDMEKEKETIKKVTGGGAFVKVDKI